MFDIQVLSKKVTCILINLWYISCWQYIYIVTKLNIKILILNITISLSFYRWKYCIIFILLMIVLYKISHSNLTQFVCDKCESVFCINIHREVAVIRKNLSAREAKQKKKTYLWKPIIFLLSLINAQMNRLVFSS